MSRCFGDGDPLYERYHDEEWGRPITSERGVFERLSLEAFQAGLSWIIVLRKREALRRLFADFDPDALADFPPSAVGRIIKDASGIRNRAKIEAVLENARAVVALRESGQTLDAFVWSFRPEVPSTPRRFADIPSATNESVALSKALRKLGFRFVGPTTAYAAMQAIGVVDDHLVDCEVREEVERERVRALRELTL